MPKPFNPQILSRLLYEAPDRANKTLRQTADEIGIDTRYLSRQLNPDDPGAKLGVEDFVHLTGATDTAALDYIEQAFGRVAVPIPTQDHQANNTQWYNHIARISKETGECISVLATALADGDVSKREVAHCMQETYEAIKALAALWVKLKDM
jgi:hypothetical protein